MNKPRIFPKSLKIEGSNLKTTNQAKCLSPWFDIICKSHENYSFTVYKCQLAEITLVLVPTSIFTFSYTTDIK